jgi:hypothetical protein
LVNGDPRPLDTDRCATPDLEVGNHRIRLPGRASKSLRVKIREPRCSPSGELVGWHRGAGGWPASVSERRRIDIVPGSGTLHGARLVGDWPPRRAPEPEPTVLAPRIPDGTIPDDLAAMLLAVRLRTGGRVSLADSRNASAVRSAAAKGANPLVRGLLRVSYPYINSGTNKA